MYANEKHDQATIDSMKNYIKDLEWKLNSKVQEDKYRYNLMSHYPNYILLASTTNTKLFKTYDNKITPRDKNEAQFQVSIKVPIFTNIFNSKGDLFVSYTQNSFWQVYDKDDSSPFRETNYQPELFWQLDLKNKNKIGLKTIRISAIHQSNGRTVTHSRSWNRSELHMLFEAKKFFYGLNIWNRWNEPYNDDANSTRDDDNPYLTKFIGNQKIFVGFKYKRFKNTLTYQNDIFDFKPDKGNIVVDIILPSNNHNFNYFLRYFDGYGETLIDYDKDIRRYSFGIIIASPFW